MNSNINFVTRMRELEILVIDLAEKNMKLEKQAEKKALGDIELTKFLED